MTLDTVDLLFNLLVLLFWMRIWQPDPVADRWNPYLAGLAGLTQPVMDLGRRRSGTAPAWLALVPWMLLILFRGVALPWMGTDSIRQSWVLELGFEWLYPAQTALNGAWSWILFSLFSFAVFLFKVWGVSLLLLRGTRGVPSSDPVATVLYRMSQPFSDLKPAWRISVLLAYGFLLIAVMHGAQAGNATPALMSFPPTITHIAQAVVSAAAGIADLLMPLQSLLIILIIGSWAAMFGGVAFGLRCQEWLAFILAPFRRFPLHLGPLDLTPLLAFAACGLLHWMLNGPYGVLRLLFLFLGTV